MNVEGLGILLSRYLSFIAVFCELGANWDRDALMESYAGMVGGALEDLAPEERHQIYKLLRLGVRYRPDWPLEITGVFAQVAEEA